MDYSRINDEMQSAVVELDDVISCLRKLIAKLEKEANEHNADPEMRRQYGYRPAGTSEMKKEVKHHEGIRHKMSVILGLTSV